MNIIIFYFNHLICCFNYFILCLNHLIQSNYYLSFNSFYFLLINSLLFIFNSSIKSFILHIKIKCISISLYHLPSHRIILLKHAYHLYSILPFIYPVNTFSNIIIHLPRIFLTILITDLTISMPLVILPVTTINLFFRKRNIFTHTITLIIQNIP